MSEGMYQITKMAEEQPKFLALLCVGLLFKLGGQQSFTVIDLHNYNVEFDGMRVVYDVKSGQVVVTLHRGGDHLGKDAVPL